MSEIAIWSPVLELVDAAGNPVPSAQGLDPEALAKLRQEVGQSLAANLRQALAVLTLMDPSFRMVAGEGVTVTFVDGEGRPEFGKGDRVQVIKTPRAPVCYKCSGPSTGYEVKLVCAGCTEQKRVPVPPAPKA